MNAKYVKRLCSVRGCKNTDSFMISLTREMGNSVIICRECAKAAFGAIKVAEKAKPIGKKKTGIPPLFFNGNVKVATEVVKEPESTNAQGANTTGNTEQPDGEGVNESETE